MWGQLGTMWAKTDKIMFMGKNLVLQAVHTRKTYWSFGLKQILVRLQNKMHLLPCNSKLPTSLLTAKVQLDKLTINPISHVLHDIKVEKKGQKPKCFNSVF